MCKRALSDEQVLRILQDLHGNTTALAREMGIHVRTVGTVKNGRSYRDVAPELPRKRRLKACTGCRHWLAGVGCTMDFPEARGEQGRYFATECDSYYPN